MKNLDAKHIGAGAVGILLTLLLTQVWNTVFRSDFSHAEIKSDLTEKINNLSTKTAEEIAHDRARISSLESKSSTVDAWLSRIENKLDKVISK